MWDKEFFVDLDSMNPENTEAGIPVLNAPGITVYTDGSQKEGRTGAGVVFYHAGTPIEVEGAQLLLQAPRPDICLSIGSLGPEKGRRNPP